MAELWDLYNIRQEPLGRVHPRGKALLFGEYHIVVFAWAVREDGRILMTRRAPEKSYAGFYECTGGCALAGETPEQAAVRELREETGLVSSQSGVLARCIRRVDDFMYTFIFRFPADAEAVPQPGETAGPEWLTPETYDRAVAEGRVVPTAVNFRELTEKLPPEQRLF